jgi:hypothetical protein
MKCILMLPLFLSGCAGTAMIGHAANYAVSEYCEIPVFARKLVRTELAETLAPHSIEIHCD